MKNIENLLNVTHHFSTEYSPYELHYGRPITDEITKFIKFPSVVPLDYEQMLYTAKQNIEKKFARRIRGQKVSKIVLKTGDLVLLRVRHLSNAIDRVTKKFFHLFEGPFVIAKELGQNTFLLVDPNDEKNIKGVYNRSNLRKYYT